VIVLSIASLQQQGINPFLREHSEMELDSDWEREVEDQRWALRGDGNLDEPGTPDHEMEAVDEPWIL
jgi:hypothetical protein